MNVSEEQVTALCPPYRTGRRGVMDRPAYCKPLAAILRAAHGAIDPDTRAPIDVGEHVVSLRQTCDSMWSEIERLRDELAECMVLLDQASAALKYHREQTRPIHESDEAIAAIDAAHKGGGE